MKRILMFGLAVGSVTLATACGDDGDGGVQVSFDPLTVEGAGDGPIALEQGTVGSDYSAEIMASGGSSRGLRWSLQNEDQFPPGLYISTQLNPLRINGRPRTAGDFNFRIRVTDSTEAIVDVDVTMTIVDGPPPLGITTESLPSGSVDAEYGDFQFEAEGGTEENYVFSVDVNTLPPGMFLDATGILSGTPTRGGAFPIVVAVADSAGDRATRSYTLEISEGPECEIEILTRSCPDAKEGEVYECTIDLSGDAFPITIELGAGSELPAGLELVQPEPTGMECAADGSSVVTATGFIRGVPLDSGQVAFQILARDVDRGLDRQSFFMFVDEPDPPLRVTGRLIYPDVPDSEGDPTEAFVLFGFEVNKRTRVEVVAIGGNPPYSWQVQTGPESLPPGCAFTSTTPNSLLDCTPMESGSWCFTLRVEDADGESNSREFCVDVRDEVFPVSIPTAVDAPQITTLPTATISTSTVGPSGGLDYQATIEAEGGVPDDRIGYGWRVTPVDGLPPGLTIFATGEPTFITGVPTATGTYEFDITVFDSEQRQSQAPFRIEVVTSTSPKP